MAKKSPVGRRGFLKGAAGAAAARLRRRWRRAARRRVSAPRRKLRNAWRRNTAAFRRAGCEREVFPCRSCRRLYDGPARVRFHGRRHQDAELRLLSAPILDRASAALHESLVNYGGNKAPELITCCHEESSVAMAHGYFKIEGKPLMVMAHGTVGLQHASMAIYNAYADRVPVYIVLGNIQDINFRAQRRGMGA